MNDLIMIVIRFLLYLDLMVIFGLPFFQIYGISGVRHETYNLTNFRSFITFAVVTGIILTGINMLLVSNAMSGVTDLRELSIHVIEMVIEETGNDSNLLIVFYVQIMPDDFVMQLHRF
ncbi:Copper resistance protein D [Escherichia coli]|nr:Copper resistance protein D [Escherichia coli]CTS72669.1 Copper resistance protein D [Escherichia coli]